MSKLRIFISYPGTDGKDFAVQTKDILEKEGYRTWFYNHHRTFGYLPWEEISDIILNKCDIFLYLCTVSSKHSRGQKFESEYAMQNLNLWPQVIIINGATCPQKLSIFNREYATSNDFEERLEQLSSKLTDILEHNPELDKKEKTKEISV